MNKLLLTLFVCGGFAVTTLAEDLTGLAEDTGAAVASVKVGQDETSYTSLKGAFDYVNDNVDDGVEATITLLQNATTSDVHTLNVGKKAVLNLRNKTLTWQASSAENSRCILNNGDLTIKASAGGGIKNSNNGYGLINNCGTLVIYGGTFTYHRGNSASDDAIMIRNYSQTESTMQTSLLIAGGTFNITGDILGGTLLRHESATPVKITGGTFALSSAKPIFDLQAGTVTVIEQDALLKVKASYSEASLFKVSGSCNLTISSGTFESSNITNIRIVKVSDTANVTIQNGTFTGSQELFEVASGYNGKFLIRGGYFSWQQTSNYALVSGTDNGKFTVEGGQFIAVSPHAFVLSPYQVYEEAQSDGIMHYMVDSENNWITVADTSWYENDLDATAYTITTPEQLAGLAQLVNGGNAFQGKTINLANHIHLEEKFYREWTPIGDYTDSKPFSGTFDGQGFTVSGLSIESETYGGLFGFIREDTKSRDSAVNAVIKNVTVTGTITGGSEMIAGGVVAVMEGGTIRLCASSVEITKAVKTTTHYYLVGKATGTAKILENNVEDETALNKFIGETDGGENLIVGQDVKFAYDKDVTADTEYKVVSGTFFKINTSSGVVADGSTITEANALYVVAPGPEAPNYIAQSGFVVYTNLQEAVNHDYVQPNATIELLKNITLTEMVTIDKSLVIEMKGFEIASVGSLPLLLNVTAHLVTMRNGFLKDTDASNAQRTLYIGTGSVVTMSNCDFTSSMIAIDCDGSLDWESGTIAARLTAVRLGMTAGANTTTTRFILREGIVKQALAIMNGEVEIRGGTLDTTQGFSGSHSAGINFYLSGRASLTMTGGTVKVDSTESLFHLAETGSFSVSVSGGAFNKNEIPAAYLVPGATLTEDDAAGMWIVGSAVAQIGTTTYSSLGAALADASESQVIHLLCDIYSATDTITIDKNITLNLGSYTIYNAKLMCIAPFSSGKRISIRATTGGIVNATGCIYAGNNNGNCIVRVYDGNYICSPNVDALGQDGKYNQTYQISPIGGTYSAAVKADGTTNLEHFLKNDSLPNKGCNFTLRDNGDTTYTIIPSNIAKVGNTYYATVELAIAALGTSGGTVTIVANEVTWPKVLPTNVTINRDANFMPPAPVGYKWNSTTLEADYTPLAIVPGNVGGTAGVTYSGETITANQTTFTFKAEEMPGYTFAGWTTPDGKYVSTAATAEVTVTDPESIMLTANFIPEALYTTVLTNRIAQLAPQSPAIQVVSEGEGELVANIALQLLQAAALEDAAWSAAELGAPMLDTDNKTLRIKLPLTDAATQFFYFAPMKE